MKVAITEEDYRAAIQERLSPLATSHVMEAARKHAAMRLMREARAQMHQAAQAMQTLTGEPWRRAQREFDRAMKRGDALMAIAFPGRKEGQR